MPGVSELKHFWRRSWLLLLVFCLLAAPLVVVGIWLYFANHWAPVFDAAMIEMRVRDVGTRYTPLIGLPGRLGDRGSHPGPLSFYLLAPIYRLLGSSYVALRSSIIAWDLAAISSSLLIARRRADTPAVLSVGLLLALLELSYGTQMLTLPWNPYLPAIWFVVFLMAVWSVADRDLCMLPVAAASGSICAQTHIPYLAVCGALGAMAVVSGIVFWLRARHGAPDGRAHLLWLLATLAVVFVAWTPPVIEEVTQPPGNLSIVFQYFRHPPAPLVGLRAAVLLVLEHLDGWCLVVDSVAQPGLIPIPIHSWDARAWRGAVLFALWAGAALGALKLRNRTLQALHATIAISLVVELVAFSRIIGAPFSYLMFWGWGIGALSFSATLATGVFALYNRAPERRRARMQVARALCIGLIAGAMLRLTFETKKAGSNTLHEEAQLAALLPATKTAIERRVGAATGAEGRYLVTWSDSVYGAGSGLGLLNELERFGLRAGVPAEYARAVTKHRILEEVDATARIHLAIGPSLEIWRRTPSAVEVAFADERSPAELLEFMALHHYVGQTLSDLGRGDLAATWESNLSAGPVREAHPFVALALGRMGEIGVPAAVFIAPVPKR